jgi:hypothetical protein
MMLAMRTIQLENLTSHLRFAHGVEEKLKVSGCSRKNALEVARQEWSRYSDGAACAAASSAMLQVASHKIF